MDKGNVLVIGNSGVGKSTLINSVLGEERAETSYGTAGTTRELKLYETDNIPFRIIDTVGFEPSFLKELQAIRAVRTWSKNSAKNGQEDNGISVIWFCVDGTTRKLFSKAINDLSKATAMWESVPVVVVITKSYSIPERAENIEMVNTAFAKQKRYSKNLRKVIPVVASTYVLNESAYAPPDGISELINITNELMPEGVRAGKNDIAKFILNRKRALAQGTVGAAAVAATIVGAVPIPFADAFILSPIEMVEVNALSQIYKIRQSDETTQFFNSIVEVGTVSTAAKAAISALKAIPGINIGASILNAIIAGGIATALGEGTIYAFEQVYLGEKTTADIDWVKKIIESSLSSSVVDITNAAIAKVTQDTTVKDTGKIISDIIKNLFDSSVASKKET